MEREEAGEPAAPSPVERATGDDWLAWLNEHGNQMLSYAAARVASRDEAEEVVQDTLLAALRAQKQYEGRSSPKTWLFAILRHKLVDHYRRQKRHQNLEFREDVESALFDNGHWKRTPRLVTGPDGRIAEFRVPASPEQLHFKVEYEPGGCLFEACRGGSGIGGDLPGIGDFSNQSVRASLPCPVGYARMHGTQLVWFLTFGDVAWGFSKQSS